jgi:hypothetical protein
MVACKFVRRLDTPPQRIVYEIGHKLGHRKFVKITDDPNQRVETDGQDRKTEKDPT